MENEGTVYLTEFGYFDLNGNPKEIEKFFRLVSNIWDPCRHFRGHVRLEKLMKME